MALTLDTSLAESLAGLRAQQRLSKPASPSNPSETGRDPLIEVLLAELAVNHPLRMPKPIT